MSSVEPPVASMHYLQAELEELVRENAAVFRWLQDGSLDGVWYWDLLDQQHEWMSPRFWETFGYDPESKPHLAAAWQDMIDPDDLAMAAENLGQHLADPDHAYDQIVRYRHRDGSTVWVRCRGVAIRDADGTPRRMLGAHTDVTPIKRAELELAASNASLQEINADLHEFAYAASHDLRSPLRTMRGILSILRQDHGASFDDDANNLLDMIEGAALRMQGLTDSVVDLARSAGGEWTLEPVDLSKLVADVEADLGAEMAESGATFDVGEMPMVQGSALHLRRLIQNLAENSIRFRDPNRPLNIRIAATRRLGRPDVPVAVLPSAERVEITVSDNGIGLEPRFAEEIFAPFRRLHGRDEYPGTGLGLTLCRRVVSRHGGTIAARRNEPAGLAVSFTLPRAPSSPAERPGA
ncbi:MAG: ATP-binding protein [Phycisphaerales bacterium]